MKTTSVEIKRKRPPESDPFLLETAPSTSPTIEQLRHCLPKPDPPGRFKQGDAVDSTNDCANYRKYAAEFEVSAPGDRFLGPFLLVHTGHLSKVFGLHNRQCCSCGKGRAAVLAAQTPLCFLEVDEYNFV